MSVTISISKDITKSFIPHSTLFTKLHEVTELYNYSSTLFTDSYRDSKHVKEFSSVMIYDFDTGELSIEQLTQHLKAVKVTALITTSRNHLKVKNDKPACERFRLIIKLSDRLIIQPADYSEFYIFFARVLNINKFIDSACKDASRFYYPNPNQNYFYILTDYDLDVAKLVSNFYAWQDIQKKENKESNKKSATVTSPKSSKAKTTSTKQGLKQNELSPSQEFETKLGEIKHFRDFDYLQMGETASVRCVSGSHRDKNPSAFISRSNSGDNNLRVHCVACGFERFMGASDV